MPIGVVAGGGLARLPRLAQRRPLDNAVPQRHYSGVRRARVGTQRVGPQRTRPQRVRAVQGRLYQSVGGHADDAVAGERYVRDRRAWYLVAVAQGLRAGVAVVHQLEVLGPLWQQPRGLHLLIGEVLLCKRRLSLLWNFEGVGVCLKSAAELL